MFDAQIVDDGPTVVDPALDPALVELWAELDARCDPVLVAAEETALAASLARVLALDPDPSPVRVEEPGGQDGLDWPPYDGAAVLYDTITDQQRELARGRALLAGAVSDRDDALAAVEALRSRLGQAQDAVTLARTELRVARQQLVVAREATVRAVGERDLARADLTYARTSEATPGPDTDGAEVTPNGESTRDGGAVTGSSGADAATAPGLAGSGLAQDPGPGLAGVLAVLVGDLALTPPRARTRSWGVWTAWTTPTSSTSWPPRNASPRGPAPCRSPPPDTYGTGGPPGSSPAPTKPCGPPPPRSRWPRP